jgi:hypothetical protein
MTTEELETRYAEIEDDEEVGEALYRDLVHCFFDASNTVEASTLLLDHVLRFAALAVHLCSYELAGVSRDLGNDPEHAAGTLLRGSAQAYVEYLTDQAVFAAVGRTIDAPPLKLRLDRKFRRSLQVPAGH